MKELLEILEDHIQSVRNQRCACGWRPQYPSYSEGREVYGYEGTQHRKHLAEMLKPLLAKVYAVAFSGGFELAADDIGAWDVLTDHGVTLADYGLTNPYKEETE